MSDYSAVAPPQNFQSTAFAAALQRAKQIAAKINPSGSTNSSQKRPLEDGNEPDAKKVGLDNNQSGLGGAAAQAAAQAAAVAARVAASSHGLGVGLGAGMPGPVISEDIKVPDKMVGLIIGRGGEQITRLQSESGCKIQMAPDSAGQPERVCSLAGTRDAITRAKDLIMNIVHQRGRTEGYGPMGDIGGTPGPNQNSGGVAHIEIMVPGPKVGLIIGKGGETIKQLQEKSGAKMVVIQDGPNQEQEKPLRISGDPQKVEYAKQLVYDLIAEKEMQAYNRRGGGGGGGGGRGEDPGRGPGLGQGYNDYGGGGGGGNGVGGGGGGSDSVEVGVPRAAVGVVIGKGGDMIKKIQAETGARVQFQQGRDEGPGDRRCLLTGKPQHVEMARQRIEELIDSVIRRDDGPAGGRNNSRGSRDRGGGGGGYERMGPGNPRNGQDYGGGAGAGSGWGPERQEQQMEVTFVVPSNKCGVIIGKGGETIKQINQQSGAHCELDRRATGTTAGSDKTFVIRGTPEQVENCKRIISEKVQMLLNFVCTSGNGMPATASYPGMAPQGYTPQGWGAPAGYQQTWQHSGPQAPGAAAPDPATSQALAVPGAATTATVQLNPQTGQPDYSMQWAEYYRSLGMHREAEMIEQQAKSKAGGAGGGAPSGATGAQPGPQVGQPGTVSNGAASSQAGVPTQPGAGSQPDYSAQWAEYYRSIGKIKEAEAIEAQMKNKGAQPGGAGQAGPGTQVMGSAAAQPGTQTSQFQPQPQTQAAYGAYQQAAGYYAAQQQPGAPQGTPQGQYNFQAYNYGQPGAPDN